jgi:hypothetical protein
MAMIAFAMAWVGIGVIAFSWFVARQVDAHERRDA